MSIKKPKLMLGEVLINNGILNQDQLRIALKEQKRQNIPLGKILVKLGFVSDTVIRDVLGKSIGQDSIILSSVIADAEAIKMIPKDVARRYHLVPISFEKSSQKLTIAMSDTFNVVALDKIGALLKGDIEINPMLASESDIETAIDQFYGFELSIDGIIDEIETGNIDYDSLQTGSNEYSQPLIRLVDSIFADAVKKRSSDIHFEPEQSFLRIRYRIDGVLRLIRTIHSDFWSGISVRLKVLAGMNIAETRAPQDGRISLTLFGRPVDFRVASQPTTHGENIVLRILDRQKGIVPLEDLQLSEETLTALKILMARPEGIILVTGPTGSGKTTTLYSMLNHVNRESVNIMTLEDPVEYPMPLIRQTSVNESVKLDFVNGIRSMMRQDPDIILIGEIRDEDTSEMAFRAAMTGHQVYSTLHTNSAIGSIPRLLDIGVKPDVMSGNIIGIIAQRLIRRLCEHCKQEQIAGTFERRLLGLKEQDKDVAIYHAVGCDHCEHQGYKGRSAIIEILRVDPEIDDLIARHATLLEIRNAANKKGFVSIADDGIRKVLQGITTIDEISRVADLTQRVG